MPRKLRETRFDRTYKNTAERSFAEAAREDGWEVTKRGYPDFICYRGDDVMLVEVKKNANTRLKLSQSRIMNFLAKRGVKCYKWSPDKDWITRRG